METYSLSPAGPSLRLLRVDTMHFIKAMCLGGGPSKKNASGMRNLSLVTHAIGKADYVYRAKRLTSRFLFPDSLFSFNHIHGSLYLQSSALVRCSSCSIIQVQTFTNLHGDTAN